MDSRVTEGDDVARRDGMRIPRVRFARMLGVELSTLDSWGRGRLAGLPLPAVRVGGRTFYRLRDYRLWQRQVDALRVRGPRPPQERGGGRRAKRAAEECLRGHGVRV